MGSGWTECYCNRVLFANCECTSILEPSDQIFSPYQYRYISEIGFLAAIRQIIFLSLLRASLIDLFFYSDYDTGVSNMSLWELDE